MRIKVQRVGRRVEVQSIGVHTFMGDPSEEPFTTIGAYDDPQQAIEDAEALLLAAREANRDA